jgi:hypothetical protein
MVRELGGFSADVLNRAAREIVRTRKEPKTPLISECIGACLDAKKLIDIESNKGKLPIGGGGWSADLDWTADRLKLATELVHGPMGMQAAKEGWIGTLYSFARKNSRLPQPGKEVDGVKRDAREFDEAYEKTVRGECGTVSAALQRLGAEMLRRRNELADRVLKGAR